MRDRHLSNQRSCCHCLCAAGKLVCVEELKSVDVMASFRMDGGRCQPANTSGDRFRHLRCMLTASQGFPLKTVAAGRRGAPSARLTSRPEPLALRVSWYGSHTLPQAISGLGVNVKCRVLMFGLLSKIRLIVGLSSKLGLSYVARLYVGEVYHWIHLIE